MVLLERNKFTKTNYINVYQLHGTYNIDDLHNFHFKIIVIYTIKSIVHGRYSCHLILINKKRNLPLLLYNQ